MHLRLCQKTDRVTLLEELWVPWDTIWFRSHLKRNSEDLFVERDEKMVVLLWSLPQRDIKTSVGSSGFI